MSKRAAGSDLHQDNWQNDDGSEEMGVFQKASNDAMKMRRICKGKRTLAGISSNDNTGPSIFQNLKSFGKSSSSAIPSFNFAPSDSTSPLKKLPSSLFEEKISEESSTNSTKLNTTCDTDIESPSMFQYKPSSNDAKPKRSIDEQSLESSKSLLFSFDSTKETEKETTSPFTDKCKTKSPFSVSSEKLQSLCSNFTEKSKPSSFFSMTSFGSNNSEKNSTTSFQFSSTKEKNNTNKSTSPKSENGSHSDDYLSDLKSLNEGVFQWIKDHLDKNKFVNLNPIFDDYKIHFEKLKQNKTKNTSQDGKKTSSDKASFSLANADKSSFNLTSAGKTSSTDKKSSFLTDVKSSSAAFPAIKTSGFNFSSLPMTITSDNASIFSFGSGSGSGNNESTLSSRKSESKISSGFSFGTSTNNFSFATKTNESSSNNQAVSSEEKEESDEPPKVEVNEVKEENAIYEKKVKLFYKKENNYVDKGIGTLFLKQTDSKVQLIVRALTNLGNILLNIVLNDSLPTQRMGKNNVLLVCVPNPPIDTSNPSTPVTMLIRVKTANDADELLAKIDENKKN